MEAFKRKNLQHIKDRFTEATGVSLDARRRRRPLQAAMAAAAATICCLTMTAFAARLFSPLSGDALALSASYEGGGIVSIWVENRSDRDLRFQPQLKLMRWSTSEEIEPASGAPIFTGTKFKAHSSGIMTVDISQAYQMEALEQPLADDSYYFVLTNQNFAFGQDWMCFIDFAEPVVTPRREPVPAAPVAADLAAEMPEALRPYFETYVSDPAERNRLSDEYLLLCRQLLEQVDGVVVPSVAAMALTVKDPGEAVIFDTAVPADRQQQLTGLHHRTTDGYDKKIGASDEESALTISAYLPQKEGETDGGAGIPLLYLLTYEAESIQSPQNYAFIRGRLLTFEQLEPDKVYEDGQYVCYNVSRLFYSDLRQYVESLVSQRSDVYFDEQIWARVESIHRYYSEHIGELLCRRQPSAPAQ